MKHFLTSIGTLIVEQSSGKPLAKVSDLIFDTETGKLRALLTDDDTILLFSNVAKWGTKIHVKSSVFLQDLQETPSVQTILDKGIGIIGNAVKDENDVFFGYCEDFVFHEKTGMLISIVAKKSFLELFFVQRFIISSNEILEMTEDCIRVKGTQMKNAVPEV